MSAQALKVQDDNTALLAFVHPADTYSRYWRATLSAELMGSLDVLYAAKLRSMLDELDTGQLILPIRCKLCACYFLQDGGAVQWRRFCGAACRKQFPREVL